jgi:hypothetical protein
VTQTGKVMGTPAFASPEQLRGDEIDARSDIYAVGATLFTLLTARAPFEGDNAVQVVANVIDTPRPGLADSATTSPGPRSVIARCLAKDPRAGTPTTPPCATRCCRSARCSRARDAGPARRRRLDRLPVTAFLPTYATLMVTVGPEALFIRPLYEFTLAAWRYHLLVFGWGSSTSR